MVNTPLLHAKDQGEVPKKTVTKRPGPAQGDDSGASAKATSTAVKKQRKSTQPELGKILCISSQSKWAVHVDDYTAQPLHVLLSSNHSKYRVNSHQCQWMVSVWG